MKTIVIKIEINQPSYDDDDVARVLASLMKMIEHKNFEDTIKEKSNSRIRLRVYDQNDN